MLLALPLTLLLSTSPQTPEAPPPPPYFTLGEPSPVVELWCELRYQAETAGPSPTGALAEAVLTAREVDSLLSRPEMWSLVDGAAITAEPGTWLGVELVLPKHMIAEGHKRKELRAALDNLFAALDSLWADWNRNEWPARKPVLEERRLELQALLTPEATEKIWGRIQRWLTLTRPPEPFVVHLVTRSAPPGGVTVYSKHRATSLVSVSGRDPSLLCEVVVHELLHALETTPGNPPPVTKEVLAALTKARVKDAKARYRWMHTLYFLAAAELVRQVIDPEHVDYGISQGYYDEAPTVLAGILPIWNKYIDGELPRRDFVRGIAKAALAAQAAENPSDGD